MRVRLRWCGQDRVCSAWRRVGVWRPDHRPVENESPSDECARSDRRLPPLLVLVRYRQGCDPAGEYPPLAEIPYRLHPASRLERPCGSLIRIESKRRGGTALDLKAILAPAG